MFTTLISLALENLLYLALHIEAGYVFVKGKRGNFSQTHA